MILFRYDLGAHRCHLVLRVLCAADPPAAPRTWLWWGLGTVEARLRRASKAARGSPGAVLDNEQLLRRNVIWLLHGSSCWPCPLVGFWVQQSQQQHHASGIRVVTSFLVRFLYLSMELLIISWKLDTDEEAVGFAWVVNERVDGLFVQESDDGASDGGP